MQRRTFLGLGLGVLGLACSRQTGAAPDGAAPDGTPSDGAAPGGTSPDGAAPGASPAASAASDGYARRADVPGFQDVGPWTGAGPAPVLVQLRLNINDFMRVEREAAAVQRWLDLAARTGAGPTELSFTGHVLQAFVEQTPDLVTRVAATQPAIYQHYRVLQARRLMTTEREVYYTVPQTLDLDGSRCGPCLLIQKTFGVTPADNGGALAGLFRAQWTASAEQRALEALGFHLLDRQSQVGHPDRIVAAALPDPGPADGHEQVEAYLGIHRLVRDLNGGGRAAPSPTMLLRMAQLAWEMGFGLTDIEGFTQGLPDPRRLKDFGMGMAFLEPRAGEFQGLSEAQRLAVGQGLAARIAALPSIGAELRDKLARLPTDRVHAVRLAWHASNEYTVEPWGAYMWGERGTFPHPMQPARTRPEAQQEAIKAAMDSIFEVFAADPRTRFASHLRQTQWAPENGAAGPWRDWFGVDLARAPSGVSPEAIEARARAQGIEIPDPAGDKPRGGRPGGGAGRR